MKGLGWVYGLGFRVYGSGFMEACMGKFEKTLRLPRDFEGAQLPEITCPTRSRWGIHAGIDGRVLQCSNPETPPGIFGMNWASQNSTSTQTLNL